MVLQYLSSDNPEHSIAPLELLSARHMKEILILVKALFRENASALAFVPSMASVNVTPNDAGVRAQVRQQEWQQKQQQQQMYVISYLLVFP